uniref:Claudin 10 n=1 Tax=Salmo trutta TaxID=8032 RepID=A0A674F4I6_SALTR
MERKVIGQHTPCLFFHQFGQQLNCHYLAFSLCLVSDAYREAAITYRTVAMYMEIGCLVLCVSGWILVCSTIIVLTTSNYFSNLWKDCTSDSTGVSNCKSIPINVRGIHMRIFCTKIGGSEVTNASGTFDGGFNYLVSGLCSMTTFSYYGNKVRAEFQDLNFRAQKLILIGKEIEVVFSIGCGGSNLLVVGGLICSFFAQKEGCQSRSKNKRMPVYKFPDNCMAPPSKQRYLPVSTELTEGGESIRPRPAVRRGALGAAARHPPV